jgi:hypothetical protein
MLQLEHSQPPNYSQFDARTHHFYKFVRPCHKNSTLVYSLVASTGRVRVEQSSTPIVRDGRTIYPSPTLISQTLRINAAWNQWQSGFSEPILESTDLPAPHLESRWYKSMRQFLHYCGGSIRLDKTFVQGPESLHDFHIMDYVISSGLFDDEQIKIANYHRLYLNVTSVSELFDATGTHMLPHMLECIRPPWFNPSTIITLQRRPSGFQRRTVWKRLCREWCTHDLAIAASLTLGPRTVPGNVQRLRRETYWEVSVTPMLYHWHDEHYWIYHPTILDPSIFVRFQSVEAWEPTADSIPITVQLSGVHLQLTSPIPQPLPSIPRPFFHHDFHSFASTAPAWEIPLLEHAQFFESPYEIMERLSNPQPRSSHIVLVSDGSQICSSMAFGWVLGTRNGEILAVNYGPGIGVGTSHRAEGWGKLSGVCFLKRLSEYTRLPFPPRLQLQTISDNEGLITRLKSRRQSSVVYANSTLDADWDITEAIHTTIQHLQIPNHSYGWVKGHQDDHRSFDDLPVVARFNIRADELAEEYMLEYQPTHTLSPLLPACRCNFNIGPITHQGHYVREIRKTVALPALYAYLRRHNGWPSDTESEVEWDFFQEAADNYAASDNHLLKLVFDQLPTLKHKSKSYEWVSSTCKHCDQPESFDHLMRCQHSLSEQFRKKLPAAVLQYCNKQNAP